MAYCIIKYRNKSKDQRAKYEPENKKLEVWLTAITTVGVVAMLAPGLIVWGKFVSPPEDASIVEAVGLKPKQQEIGWPIYLKLQQFLRYRQVDLNELIDIWMRILNPSGNEWITIEVFS